MVFQKCSMKVSMPPKVFLLDSIKSEMLLSCACLAVWKPKCMQSNFSTDFRLVRASLNGRDYVNQELFKVIIQALITNSMPIFLRNIYCLSGKITNPFFFLFFFLKPHMFLFNGTAQAICGAASCPGPSL